MAAVDSNAIVPEGAELGQANPSRAHRGTASSRLDHGTEVPEWGAKQAG